MNRADNEVSRRNEQWRPIATQQNPSQCFSSAFKEKFENHTFSKIPIAHELIGPTTINEQEQQFEGSRHHLSPSISF